MASSEFTKTERRELRELAGEVYEAEAHEYLEGLDRDFALWRKGEMLSSDLLTSIHQFHQHENRELWKMYQGVDDEFIVARALRVGLLQDSKVSPKVLEKLRRLLNGP